MEKKNEVILVNGKNPVDILRGNAKEFIAEMALKVNEQVFDVETSKGRASIISQSVEITRTKTAIDKAGKNLTTEWRDKVKKVNDDRKKIWDGLDALSKKVREPVTVWEKGEEVRVSDLKKKLEGIESLERCDNLGSVEILGRIDTVKHITITDEEFAEFLPTAETLIKTTLKQLEASFIIAENKESKDFEESWGLAIEFDKKLEAEKLVEIERKEQEKVDTKKREAKIAEDAKAKERKAAKEKIDKANEQKKNAAKKLSDLKKQTKINEANAEKERLQSIEDTKISERKKVDDQKKKDEDEQAKRDADIKHRRKANDIMLEALVSCTVDPLVDGSGITEQQAKQIIQGVVSGMIPKMSVKY